jgi:hypothetical protein
MASRFDDPAEADRLVEAIAAGGVNGAASAFGVERLTIWRWGQDGSKELQARIAAAKAEHAGKLGQSPGLREIVDAEVMPELAAAVPERRRAREHHTPAPRPSGDDIDLPRASPSRTGRMSADELQDHLEYAVRHPDHPFAPFAIKILVEQHFGPALIRNRRQAEHEPVAAGTVKVLREPVPLPEPKADT